MTDKAEIKAIQHNATNIQVTITGTLEESLTLLNSILLAHMIEFNITSKDLIQVLEAAFSNSIDENPSFKDQVNTAFKSKKSDLLDKLMRSVVANLPEKPQRLEDN